MEYPELSKLFHMETSSARYAMNEAEAARRKEMDSTFIIEMLSDSKDLFIAMPREMVVLMEKKDFCDDALHPTYRPGCAHTRTRT